MPAGAQRLLALELGQPLGFGVDQRLFQCDVFSVEVAEDLDRSAQGVEIHPADTQGQRIHLRPDLAPILLEPTVVLLQPMHMLDQVHVAARQEVGEDVSLLLCMVVVADLGKEPHHRPGNRAKGHG